jgi:thioredoxin-related protein
MQFSIFRIASFAFFVFLSGVAHSAEAWQTSIEKAVEEAKKTDKAVLVKFTGSDWCPPCKAIQKSVFSQESFNDEVKKKFVLCVIDSPNSNEELTQKNKSVLEKFEISGFPTVVLLDKESKEFHRFNPSQYPVVKEMLSYLDKQLRRKEMF